MTIFHDQQHFMTTMKQEPNPGLYLHLIDEEVNEELMVAWQAYLENPSGGTLVEVLDGAVDSIYVLAGFLNSLVGPNLAQKLWDEVQASNMSKAGPEGVKFRADGKVLKPETYFKPDLARVLNHDSL